MREPNEDFLPDGGLHEEAENPSTLTVCVRHRPGLTSLSPSLGKRQRAT